MSFQDKTKILLLIPDMNTTIGTTRVANTIFIESGACKLGLLELLSESSVLEQFLACISRVPELE
jgi:hypothetical protein